MSRTGLGSNCAALKTCSRQELERRIHDVLAELSSSVEGDRGNAGGNGDFRWIAPAELVRRMRPYVVLN